MYEYAQNPLYNPQINPYFGVQRPFQSPPRQDVVKVHGEEGARAFPMSANSSALLLDEGGSIVWMVVTDGAGYKTVAAFDITPHESEPQPDYTDLESRISRLEEMVNNGSNSRNTSNAQQAEYSAYSSNASDRPASERDRNDQKRR